MLMLACEVPQSYPTLCYPMDCSLPGSSVQGILQARTLEWVAILEAMLFIKCHSLMPPLQSCKVGDLAKRRKEHCIKVI